MDIGGIHAAVAGVMSFDPGVVDLQGPGWTLQQDPVRLQK
jgi:hypothetical protein